MVEPWLLEDQAPLRPSMSAGMRLATAADLKLASRPSRRDPGERCEVRAYVHRMDVVLKFTGRKLGPGGGATRGEIRGFTHASRRRLSFLIRNTSDLWDGFLTITYPADFPTDGREVKRHLNAFCSWLRRKKIAYVWILEFQKRGAPHFHFLVKGWVDKREVAERWADIVGSWDRARHVEAGTRIEAVKNPDQVGAYMAAYMSKLDQKVVPARYKGVGRFWGASRLLTSSLHRFKGLYADAARATRAARHWYESKNRGLVGSCRLAKGHAGPCDTHKPPYPVKVKFRDRCARPIAVGYRWKWRGQGFVLIGGAPMFKSLLRQVVMADAGLDAWEDWNGEPDARRAYLTPKDRLAMKGQLLLDGGLEPLYPEE